MVGAAVRLGLHSLRLTGGEPLLNPQLEALIAAVQPLRAEDVADAVHWCVTRPPHVNVNEIELMPVAQGFSPFAVKRA